MSLRIGVLGMGAVGGLYGGLLQLAGHEVHFLVRSGLAEVRQEGLHIRSLRGQWHLPQIKVYQDVADFPVCDLVLVSWKSTSNQDLAKTLTAICHSETTVVVMQNGLDPERSALSAESPLREDQVLSGLCFLSCRREGPGRIWHQDYGAITLAAFSESNKSTEAPGANAAGDTGIPAGISPRIRAAAEVLRQTGEAIHEVADWRMARWRKLVWNMAFNGSTALTGKNTRELLSTSAGEAFALTLMQEVIDGAASCGTVLPSDFAVKMLKATHEMAPYEPSMKLDADAGRPMELEQIYDRPLQAIAKAGGRAPHLESLVQLLRWRFGTR